MERREGVVSGGQRLDDREAGEGDGSFSLSRVRSTQSRGLSGRDILLTSMALDALPTSAKGALQFTRYAE